MRRDMNLARVVISDVKEKGLGGIMYWTYNQDDEAGTLRKAVFEALQ